MAESWFFDVLPHRPAPIDGECLSGYLLRLAEANGFAQFWDFACELFPEWVAPHQLARLRWEYPPGDWGRIPQRTHLPLDRLSRMTVVPWVEKFRTLPDLSHSAYLSPGHFLRGVVNPYLTICPLCLQSQPYLRLLWRLMPVQVCLQHGCLLQARCQQCGQLLSVMAATQRSLCCGHCGADLRRQPVAMASNELLASQQRVQSTLQFLLDPDRRLVPLPYAGESLDPVRSIGLKFRYLRLQHGQSVVEMAGRLAVADGLLSQLELGKHVPLTLYLTYLEGLSLSWLDFAALQVPLSFIQELQSPPHLALRLCARSGCPNSQPPANMRVRVLADVPGRRIVRLQCQDCNCRCTRNYDGQLVTKARKPPLRPGEPPALSKPPQEIARLKAMGRQGLDNPQIAEVLGWGATTVRIYWHALGMEEQVHQAQKERRALAQRERHDRMAERVEQVLQGLLAQGTQITLVRVCQALGYGAQYLQSFPDLAERVQAVAGPHNLELRQRDDAELEQNLTSALADLKQRAEVPTMTALNLHVGLSSEYLRRHRPDLFVKVQEAIREYAAQRRATWTQAMCARIDEAAAQLIAQGARPTYVALRQLANLNKYQAKAEPLVRELLQKWVGDFAPRD